MNQREMNRIPDLDGEIWLPIDGYDNKYLISNFGRIKTLQGKHEKLKTQQVNNNGYYRVALWKDGKRSTMSVARLVGLAFIPNDDPKNKTTIHHKNFDKSLNTVDNLQWLSLRDNIRENYKKKAKASLPEEPSKKEME